MVHPCLDLIFPCQVKLDALNDSKLIGFSIYNCVVLSILGVVIGAAVTDDINMSYGCLSALQITGTTATLHIVFLPKVSAHSMRKISSTVFPMHVL